MNKQDLEACIGQYGRDIYTFCSYLARNLQETEDLYQDTFLKALELEDKLDFQQNPKSYLLSIALRIWKNRRRKFAWRRRIATACPEQEEQAKIPRDSPEETLLREEEQWAVRAAVTHLPEHLRLPVLLYYMEEMPTKQAAALLGIPPGTVLSRLHRARKLLKKELEDFLNG